MGLREVYESDRRSAELCRDMTLRGFYFDRDRARQVKEHLLTIERETLERGRAISGDSNISLVNGKRLKRAFFETLRAPIFFRSKETGEPSLNKEALAAYQTSHDPELREMAHVVGVHRNARKLRATYIDAYEAACRSDGRVHVSWNQCGTVSGRWASSLMQLPTKRRDPTYHLGGVRSCFTAAPGYQLVWFDAAQYEMRVGAYASGDPNMIQACESGDIHAYNAALIFEDAFHPEHLLLDDHHPDHVIAYGMRYLAKRSGLAVIYATSAETLWRNLTAEGKKITYRRVEGTIQKTHRVFHKYFEWGHHNFLECVRTGYVYSPILGRRRYLSHDPEETKVINFPCQAGAGDLMNIKLAQIDDEIKARDLDAHLVAQVHDNGTFEVRDDHVDQVEKIMDEVWERPVDMDSSGDHYSVVFPIDREKGPRWK